MDLRNLDEAGFRPIYRAWLDHNVLVVTGQELRIDEFLAYSRRFGFVSPHPLKSTRHSNLPEITLLGTGKFNADGSLKTRRQLVKHIEGSRSGRLDRSPRC